MAYEEKDGKMYHIGLSPDQVGKYVIMPGDPFRTELISNFFDNPQELAFKREFRSFSGYLEGEKVLTVSTGIGGPSASIAMEELIKCGATTFIRIGTCGGINTDVTGGDVVIASAAVRAEGTSREYAPIEYPAAADFGVTVKLKEAADKLGFRNHVGVVQCKDSFYGQHEPGKMPVAPHLEYLWNSYKKLGCLASEMESAAMFIVGLSRGVRVGSVFTVVGNQERALLGLSNPICKDTTGAIKVTVEAMRSIILEDREKQK